MGWLMVEAVITREQRMEQLASLRTMESRVRDRLAMVASADPFWSYIPSDGSISPDGMAFLLEWLKPEDIPDHFAGQIDAHMSTAAVLGVVGGNQSGKTTVGVIEDFIAVTGELPASLEGVYPKEKLPDSWPRRMRVVGVDFKQMNNTLLPSYQFWVPRRFLRNGKWDDSFSSQQQKLFLYSPATKKEIASIEFMTNEQKVETFQGPPLHRVRYDEEPKYEIWKENLARFITTKKNIQLNWTPTQGLTWAFERFEGEESDTDTDLIKISTVTNPRANLDSIKAILKEISSYPERKMRLLGEFFSISGFVYAGYFDRHYHVIPPFPVVCSGCKVLPHRSTCPAAQYLILKGLDPHTVKPTAVVWLAINREGMCYVVHCLLAPGTITEMKKEVAVESLGMRTGWSAVDRSCDFDIKTGEAKPLNFYRELSTGEFAIGAPRKSVKYTGSVMEGVGLIQEDLRRKGPEKMANLYFFDTPAVRPLIRIMRTLERDFKRGEELTGVRDRIREGPHDLHAALRYIYQWPRVWYEEAPPVLAEPFMYDRDAGF